MSPALVQRKAHCLISGLSTSHITQDGPEEEESVCVSGASQGCEEEGKQDQIRVVKVERRGTIGRDRQREGEEGKQKKDKGELDSNSTQT